MLAVRAACGAASAAGASAGAPLGQRRTAYFTSPTTPWKVNQTDAQSATMRLYQKQMHSSSEWEGIGSPHPNQRFLSPGEPSWQLKAGAQFNGQWAPWYQNETLRHSAVTPQYREYAPPNPFHRDLYNEWLTRNMLDDYPGASQNFVHEFHKTIEMEERARAHGDHLQNNVQGVANWDGRRQVRDELRQEKFEDYMRKRAQRNKRLGIDTYGIWSKKTLAYLKKQNDY
eukprot:TRINITY_DN28043_c0_g1_i1.p1 TRINITY_DN28043_c0_g1~~TRINITY_DN28043_c0_g1_i1.p1  ORF type:complete len:254 (+),score=50.75 TRINITY_DN28043_c0_g1_i1:80-763(+)